MSYQLLRQFDDAAATIDRALAILPDDPGLQVIRSGLSLHEQADPDPMRTSIDKIVTASPSAAPGLADEWFFLALCQRDPATAKRALAAMDARGYNNQAIIFPHSFCEALAARMEGNPSAAAAAFWAARGEMEKNLRENPNDGKSLCVLGMIDAALGRKAQALEEGHRAVHLLPISKDAINGTLVSEYLAVIFAWTGEKEAALQQLRIVAKVPSDVSYGQLRLHPFWDSLRGDPGFEAIVASLAPGRAREN